MNIKYDKITYYDNMIKLLDERIKKSQELHHKYIEVPKSQFQKSEEKDEKYIFSTTKKDLYESNTVKNSLSTQEKGKELECFSSVQRNEKDSYEFMTNSKFNPYLYSDKYSKEYHSNIKMEMKFCNVIRSTTEKEKN